MRRIRIAQIGTWKYTHAAETLETARHLPELFEVVGVCEPNEAHWRESCSRPAYQGIPRLTLEQVMNDNTLDAVFVETDELTQGEYALECAKRGFHIHMDKPGGESESVFRELIGTVKRYNTVFQVGYMYRYNPAVMKVRELIASGELGSLISVEAQMSVRYQYEMLQWLADFKGGMMFYLGCHLVDLMLLLMGEPDGIVPLNSSTGVDGSTSPDFGFALFRYPKATSFIKTTACESGGFMRRNLVVSGTRGTAVIQPMEAFTNRPGIVSPLVTSIEFRRATDPCYGFDSGRIDYPAYGRYEAMLRDFAAAVYGEKENPFPPDYELAVHRAVLKTCGIPVSDR